MAVRRVVTGHDTDGRSVVVADEQSPSFPFGTNGGAAYAVWGRDDIARFPDDGKPHPWRQAFPPPGGCRMSVSELPPGESTEFDEFVRTGLAQWADQDNPGMHRTASLDFDIVLEGVVGLELDGEEILLYPGDVVVQNGTRHRWHNRGPGIAKFAGIVIGAHHDVVGDGDSRPV
jgi:mannose-6-phosphate isomerase-like protein (cupin superfamily)